jgi:hypothetical protein
MLSLAAAGTCATGTIATTRTVSAGRSRNGEGKYQHQDYEQNNDFFHGIFSFVIFDV